MIVRAFYIGYVPLIHFLSPGWELLHVSVDEQTSFLKEILKQGKQKIS